MQRENKEFDFKCPCKCGMDMREKDYEKFHGASDEEVEHPRENKWQDRFYKELTCGEDLEVHKLLAFIQSELDRAVAEEGGRLIKEIEKANWQYISDVDGEVKQGLFKETIINLIK